jgi:hypothetical protein
VFYGIRVTRTGIIAPHNTDRSYFFVRSSRINRAAAAVTLLECLPETSPFARVPPASTGGHEIMLIKHIEQQNSVVLLYLYGRRLVMPLKRLLSKTHGRQVHEFSERPLTENLEICDEEVDRSRSLACRSTARLSHRRDVKTFNLRAVTEQESARFNGR